MNRHRYDLINQYPLVIISDFNIAPIEMLLKPWMNPNTIRIKMVKKNTWNRREIIFLSVGLMPNHPDINTKTLTATTERLCMKSLTIAFPGASMH
jgi:hypothetical protein